MITDITTDFYRQNHLRKSGVIASQYQFSTDYLGRSENYMTMLLSSKRKPPSDALHTLIARLGERRNTLDEGNTHQTETAILNRLIEQENSILMKRYLGVG